LGVGLLWMHIILACGPHKTQHFGGPSGIVRGERGREKKRQQPVATLRWSWPMNDRSREGKERRDKKIKNLPRGRQRTEVGHATIRGSQNRFDAAMWLPSSIETWRGGSFVGGGREGKLGPAGKKRRQKYPLPCSSAGQIMVKDGKKKQGGDQRGGLTSPETPQLHLRRGAKQKFGWGRSLQTVL